MSRIQVGAEIVERPEGFPRYDQLGEGPFWDVEDMALYWVDIVGRRAMRYEPAKAAFRYWDTPSVCSVAIPTTGGDLLVALRDGLHRLDPETGVTGAFAQPDLDPLNRSNDARTDHRGRLWLGTMGNNIGEDGSTVALRPDAGGLYRVGADAAAFSALSGIGISNAIAFSPDGKRMTFSDTSRDVIWSFAVDDETGALSDRQVLLEGGPGHPDGAAMDEEGCLWNARWGANCVIRITPDGRIDRTLEAPARQPSCCAFGGPALRTLYITSARQDLEAPGEADGALMVAELDVTGLPMRRFAG
jgi:sugar lactone lactonase YvrE